MSFDFAVEGNLGGSGTGFPEAVSAITTIDFEDTSGNVTLLETSSLTFETNALSAVADPPPFVTIDEAAGSITLDSNPDGDLVAIEGANTIVTVTQTFEVLTPVTDLDTLFDLNIDFGETAASNPVDSSLFGGSVDRANLDNLTFTLDLVPIAALPGNLNDDLVVDAADFVLLRQGLGETGDIATDFETFVANFTGSAPPDAAGVAVSAATAVPEPGTVVLSMLALVGVAARRRR